MGARFVGRLVQRARQCAVEDVVDQRGLAGAADAGDGREHAQRKRDVDRLQIVLASATDRQRPFERRAARLRRLDGPRARQVRARERRSRVVGHQLRRRALKDHVTAVLAGAGPEIDDVVGGSNRLLVVFYDDDRVAQIAQAGQRRQQLAVVALMQADRRLIEHVQHARQVCTNLRREPNALALSTRQRGRRTPQRQVANTDIVEKSNAILNFPQDPLGDDRFAIGQLHPIEDGERFRDRQIHAVGDRESLHLDRQTLQLQPTPVTRCAGPKRAIHVEVGLLGPGAILETPAQVGNDPFKLLPGAATTEQQDLALLARQFPERQGEVDAEIAAERLQRFANQLPIAPRPWRDRPVRERLRFVGHDARADRSPPSRQVPGSRYTRRAAS